MAFKRRLQLLFFACWSLLASALSPRPSHSNRRLRRQPDGRLSASAPAKAFTDKLQAALARQGSRCRDVANAGVSGDTTSGGLSRLDWSVPDGTQLVILELGANDMLRGVSPDITEKNLDAMLAQAEGAQDRRAARRHARRAQSRRRLPERLRRDLSAACREIRRAALSVLPRRRRRPDPALHARRRHASECRRASTGWSSASCRRSRRLIAAGAGQFVRRVSAGLTSRFRCGSVMIGL